MLVQSYVSAFLLSFLLAFLAIKILFFVFSRLPALPDSRFDARHCHRSDVSRFGGMAMIFAFIGAICLNDRLVLTTPWIGMILVSIGILAVGIWDDVRELSWQKQLLLQGGAASLAFAFGIRLATLKNPFGETIFLDRGGAVPTAIAFVLTVLWIMAIMNALNWSDGVDGLCGGIAFIAFMTIFALSLRPEVLQPPIAIAAMALAGATIGFLVFNMPPATIMAGTSGSWFLGFSLAALAIFSGTKVATTVLVLAIPVFDALRVVFERVSSGKSLFQPDLRHLHYRLQSAGWSIGHILFLTYAFTICIAFVVTGSSWQVKAILGTAAVLLTAMLFFKLREGRGDSL